MSTLARTVARKPLEWPFAAWLLPFWFAYLAYSWWRLAAAELSGSPLASQLGPAPAAALAVAGKVANALLEAGFYCLLWRAAKRRLAFWRFFAVVISASITDLFAHAIAARAAGTAAAPWLAPVAGLRLLDEGRLGAATHTAFGTLGLLTATRIGLTALAQSRATGVRFVTAFALTAAVWALTRLAILMSVDLVKGASPLVGR